MSIIVVVSHVALIYFALVFLSSRITNSDTLISTIAVFLPVFGVYVGVVVKTIAIGRGPLGRKVNPVFIVIMLLLLAAHAAGAVLIVLGFSNGLLPSEEALPAYISLLEAAFGGFFSLMFFSLFGFDDRNT
jgi:hypothetical protein